MACAESDGVEVLVIVVILMSEAFLFQSLLLFTNSFPKAIFDPLQQGVSNPECHYSSPNVQEEKETTSEKTAYCWLEGHSNNLFWQTRKSKMQIGDEDLLGSLHQHLRVHVQG